jgi:hypothetical protein
MKFEKEGSDGIGTLRTFSIISNDSIYLYNYWISTLFFLNKSSTIEKIKILDLHSSKIDGFYPPTLYPRTAAPLTVMKKKVIISGLNIFEPLDENYENTPSALLYDIEKDSIHYIGYPTLYHKGNWGGSFSYRSISHTIYKDNIVVNYPASDSLYIYDLETKNMISFYAKSKYTKKIQPVVSRRNFIPDKEIYINHYLNNISYDGVYYDKYRDVFYRLVGLPDKNAAIKDGLKKIRFSLIVIDNKHTIIGELDIPAYNYKYTNCFVSKDGFQIQVHSDNDDLLIFKTFSFYEKI